jgi:hypothetical protein
MVNAVSDCLVLIAEKTCASIFGIYEMDLITEEIVRNDMDLI